ncbi:MAG: hypothetical protein ABEJ55_02760 [Halanaeroarchaeum sp.]
MIVVATEDFEVYPEIVGALRERSARFTTRRPGDPLPEDASVVIVGPEETLDVDPPVVTADPEDPRAAVDEAMAAIGGPSGSVIVGVDPGTNPGIAVLKEGLVVSAFHVPLEAAAGTVRDEVAEESDPLVRIGDGARRLGARIIEELDDVTVELVDETGTTPQLGRGARGMGDVLAAVNIARRTGKVVHDRTIQPTAGEVQMIKNRSRERSERNQTIPESLAREVAKGQLTLEEAIEVHEREEESS